MIQCYSNISSDKSGSIWKKPPKRHFPVQRYMFYLISSLVNHSTMLFWLLSFGTCKYTYFCIYFYGVFHNISLVSLKQLILTNINSWDNIIDIQMLTWMLGNWGISPIFFFFQTEQTKALMSAQKIVPRHRGTWDRILHVYEYDKS